MGARPLRQDRDSGQDQSRDHRGGDWAAESQSAIADRLVEEVADSCAERPGQDERRPEQQNARDIRAIIKNGEDRQTRGAYQTVGCPIKLSDSPVAVTRPPLLGEHTAELLHDLCGVDPDEVARLREQGVL
jgi:crotonobetainyl-CoA:carnitine CoA-transferase CaiB-like acyl-CoA transferase